MRLRNKNWTKDFLLNHQANLIDANQTGLDPKVIFQNQNQINALEIGCGKGDFLITQSIDHPDWNLIALEKESTVVGVALRKALANREELPNLKFMNSFAEKLTTTFAPQVFDYLFLNFSDPWPKTKHFKKRLTYQTFLDTYAVILKPNGIVELKTDNNQLYEFSLEQIATHPAWLILYQTTDLYNDPLQLANNVATEYENRFHGAGKPIKKIIFQRKN